MRWISYLLVFICLHFIMTYDTVAQHPAAKKHKWGPDSAIAKNKYELFMQKWLEGNKERAMYRWYYLFHFAPGAKEGIYEKGLEMFEKKLAKATRHERKQEIIDSILTIFDRRTEFFGPDAQWLGRKAQFMFDYRLKPQYLQDIYKTAKRSLNINENLAEAPTLHVFFKLSEFGFKKGFVSKDSFKQNVVRTYRLIHYKIPIVRPSKVKAFEEVKKTVLEMMLAHNLIVICKDAQYYAEAFMEISDDTNTINWGYKALKKYDCTENLTFIRIAKKKYKYDPSIQLAEELIHALKKKARFEEAIQYYNKALAMAVKPKQKAQFHYEIAQLQFNEMDKPEEALKNTFKAISLRGDWGDPHLLAGDIYFAQTGRCPADTFIIEKQKAASDTAMQNDTTMQSDTTQPQVFRDTLTLSSNVYLAWAAITHYKMAIKADAASKEQAREKIKKATNRLVDNKAIEKYGLKVGKTYTIPCLNEEEVTIYTTKTATKGSK